MMREQLGRSPMFFNTFGRSIKIFRPKRFQENKKDE